MVNYLKILCIVFAFMAIGCGYFKTDLKGEVFIITKSGSSVPLELVDINVVPESEMMAILETFLEKKKTFAEKKINEIDEKILDYDKKMVQYKKELVADPELGTDKIYVKYCMQKKYKQIQPDLNSLFDMRKNVIDDFFNIQIPTAPITKTDSDGVFVVSLKPGKYAIIAHLNRITYDKIENYQWLVWITVTRKSNNKILLSNDNLAETFCSACIIPKQEFDDIFNKLKLQMFDLIYGS